MELWDRSKEVQWKSVIKNESDGVEKKWCENRGECRAVQRQ